MHNTIAKRFLKAVVTSLSTAIVLANVMDVCAGTTSAPYRFLPFPESLKRYEIEIFRLVDASHSIDPNNKISYYDPHLSQQFDSITKSFSNLDKRLKQKLLSGPAPRGKYLESGDNRYILYSACQAHWCNVTNVYMLYQPEKQRMVGRLLYACEAHEFGGPNNSEMEVINQIAPLNLDPDDCKFAKESQ